MSRPTKKQIASTAIDAYMREHRDSQYIKLFTLSVVADNAVGKELYSSLYEYECLTKAPKTWISASDLDDHSLSRGLGGSFLVVENPYYQALAQA